MHKGYGPTPILRSPVCVETLHFRSKDFMYLCKKLLVRGHPAPEGYVAIVEGDRAVKLVDRLSFSTANFNVEKNWVEGDKK